MNKLIILAAAVTICLTGSKTNANELAPMSIEELSSLANVVIVANAGGNSSCAVGNGPIPCAKMVDVQYIKGSEIAGSRREIWALLKNRISEMDVNCCKIGARYLMFMIFYDNKYYFVHGNYSVIELRKG